MGVRSTGSQHSTTTKADGHLLEYFRQNFGAGGGANNGPSAATGMKQLVVLLMIILSPGTKYRTYTSQHLERFK